MSTDKQTKLSSKSTLTSQTSNTDPSSYRQTIVSTIIGTLSLSLLKLFDYSCAISMILVILGFCAFIFANRTAKCKLQRIIILIGLMIAFAIKLLEYVEVPALEIVVGALVGAIIWVFLNIETLLKKFENNPVFVLITPAAITLLLILSEFGLVSSIFRIDIFFADAIWFTQIASLLGTYALDFLIILVASVFVYVIQHRNTRACISASATGVIIIAVLVFGFCRVNTDAKYPQINSDDINKTSCDFNDVNISDIQAQTGLSSNTQTNNTRQEAQGSATSKVNDDSVRVAYVNGPYVGHFNDEEFVYDDYTMDQTIEIEEKQIAAAKNQGAEIFITFEEWATFSNTSEQEFLQRSAELAKKYDMFLLLSYDMDDDDGSLGGLNENCITWISSDGSIINKYDKNNLVPFAETFDYVEGNEGPQILNLNVHGKNIRTCSVICYDSDFELYMNKIGQDCDLLIIPTWDWSSIENLHYSVSKLRAVSSNTYVLRAVYEGTSALINNFGQPLFGDNTKDVGYDQVFAVNVPLANR